VKHSEGEREKGWKTKREAERETETDRESQRDVWGKHFFMKSRAEVFSRVP